MHSFGWFKETVSGAMMTGICCFGAGTDGPSVVYSRHQLLLELSTTAYPSSLWHLSSPVFALAHSCGHFHVYVIILP